MTTEQLAQMSGAERLRLIVSNMNATTEGVNDRYNAAQLVALYTMHLLSEWDFMPDQWTERQRKDALDGYPPHWNDQEKPVYPHRAGYPHRKIQLP